MLHKLNFFPPPSGSGWISPQCMAHMGREKYISICVLRMSDLEINFPLDFNGNSFPVEFIERVYINNLLPDIHKAHLRLAHQYLTVSEAIRRMFVLSDLQALLMIEFCHITCLTPFLYKHGLISYPLVII